MLAAMTSQAFAVAELFATAAVGSGALFAFTRGLLRHGVTMQSGLAALLTATGTLAVCASITGIA